MPKQYTCPILIDEVLQINISKLSQWGYLEPNTVKSGVLNWSKNGSKTGSVSITVNTISSYIELDYRFRGEPINYRVSIVSIASNLGKGEVKYFLCPKTNKRCRILYSVGQYFYSRNAFSGAMYETQTQCKKIRIWNSQLSAYFKKDQLLEQLRKKHFKKTYSGKPTKRYLHIMNQMKKAEGINYRELEILMML